MSAAVTNLTAVSNDGGVALPLTALAARRAAAMPTPWLNPLETRLQPNGR